MKGVTPNIAAAALVVFVGFARLVDSPRDCAAVLWFILAALLVVISELRKWRRL